jgi:phage-related holin
MAARGPYIMLAVVTFCYGLYNLLAAILTRADTLDYIQSNSIFIAAEFFGNVDFAFRPAVVLYLIHVRGDVLRALTATSPLSTQVWKRILDWVLTVLIWVMLTASMGVTATKFAAVANGTWDFTQSNTFYQISLGLGQTGLAFLILLIINVAVSVVVQYIRGGGPQRSDLVRQKLTDRNSN